VSTVEEVEAAEAKMNAAKDALLQYVERQDAIDRDHHRRLVARVKKAQAEFLQAISKLGEWPRGARVTSNGDAAHCSNSAVSQRIFPGWAE